MVVLLSWAILLITLGGSLGGWSEDILRVRREISLPPTAYHQGYNGVADNHRYVSYNELQSIDRFRSSNSMSYRTILFDPENYQMIVGARDHIYRLSLKGFHLLESTLWASSDDSISTCMMKGEESSQCHNFVTLLVATRGGRLFACGSNAFSPLCSWRSLSSTSTVDEVLKGVGKVPFNPSLSSTHLMTNSGALFVGTFTDFPGLQPAFIRTLDPSAVLRSKEYDYKWFSSPHFVASFETVSFVYFFFREEGIEYLNCRQSTVPRLGRVCKDDPGGQRRQSNEWTTFLKSTLDCSVQMGGSAYHFDSIESMTYIPSEEIFYGLFSTQSNGMAGSALCAFNMTAVNRAFNGPLKYQSGPHSTWKPVRENMDHYGCKYSSDPHAKSRASINANKYQIVDTNVKPIDDRPFYVLDHQRLTHVAVDVVPTRQSGSVHVLYIAGTDGTIRKVSVVPRSSRTAVSNRNATTTCLLEVLSPFKPNSTVKIHTMKFLKEAESLYIGTEQELVRVPAHRCSRYSTRSACLGAHDPYCGWDRNALHCSPPPNKNPFDANWVQEVIDCPTETGPIDGGWSKWSKWEECQQKGSQDPCKCRHRTCDAPTPLRGGSDCTGPTTEVTNCTIHGGWTTWSSWSQCSATCGVAVKTRRRSCTNPEPRFEGRVCVGQDTNEIYCHSLPPCPVLSRLPISGGWGQWSKWSDCSSKCGNGFRQRARKCNDPIPKHGGAPCSGCETETEECSGGDCSSLTQLSTWTGWMIPLNEEEDIDDDVRRRYRVKCVASEKGGDMKIVAHLKVDERVEGQKGWGSWSRWSSCDRDCGVGQQSRWRSCSIKSCDGAESQSRACNTHNCKGQWSCWTEWSACSIPCSSGGLQKRSRTCLASQRPLLEASDCEGTSSEEKSCEDVQCQVKPGEEGWSQWSGWSSCSEAEYSVRQRTCVSLDPSTCRGLDNQKKSCVAFLSDEPSPQKSIDSSAAHVSIGSLIGACITCLLLGVLIGGLTVRAYYVRERNKHSVPSSPHYLSVKPNQYVSVPVWKSKGGEMLGQTTPTATLKHSLKRQHSSRSSKSVNRDPYATLPLKDLDPVATIKRSSHTSYGNISHNMRADLDSDTIFNF